MPFRVEIEHRFDTLRKKITNDKLGSPSADSASASAFFKPHRKFSPDEKSFLLITNASARADQTFSVDEPPYSVKNPLKHLFSQPLTLHYWKLVFTHKIFYFTFFSP